MLKSLVSSPYVNTLESALGASSLRHQVISNNIANVNTPGFKKSEVSFEGKLQSVIDSEKKQGFLARTNERHYPFQKNANVSPTINTITNTTLRVDGNNVDIDAEMAEMAKNNIYYNAIVHKVQGYFSTMKSCINGGK